MFPAQESSIYLKYLRLDFKIFSYVGTTVHAFEENIWSPICGQY